jgi:hypothetical protein
MTSRFRLASLAVIACVLVACGAQTDIVSGALVRMTLERRACAADTCPVYTVTVTSDGAVTYEGIANVSVLGRQTAQISPEAAKELVEAFEAVNFFYVMNDAYAAPGEAGQPIVVTTLQVGESLPKTVTHDLGDASAPPELTALENKIDELANTGQWTGR